MGDSTNFRPPFAKIAEIANVVGNGFTEVEKCCKTYYPVQFFTENPNPGSKPPSSFEKVFTIVNSLHKALNISGVMRSGTEFHGEPDFKPQKAVSRPKRTDTCKKAPQLEALWSS